jgi:hypothetical protein
MKILYDLYARILLTSLAHPFQNYHSGLFNFADDKMEALKRISVLIIDEVSMVDSRLLTISLPSLQGSSETTSRYARCCFRGPSTAAASGRD